jgi:hypothetical protein
MGRRIHFWMELRCDSMQSRTDVFSQSTAGPHRIPSRTSPRRAPAASVNTVPERSYNSRINLAIARYLPSLAEAAARVFSLGDETKLRSLFEAANFRDVEITTETKSFTLPSFGAYCAPIEQGAGSRGQAFVSLPDAARRAVREEVRRDLRNTGGPIEIEVEYRFGGGRR